MADLAAGTGLEVREAPASYQVMLDSMRVRPGYKQTEAGVIPEDWEASTIGENSKWMSGGTPRRNNAEFWSGTIPWISGSTLKSAEISTSDQFLTTEAVSAGSKMAPVDSTLLLVRGSALHNEIRAGLVVLPVAFNQDVKALIPNITVEPKFLTYYILAQSDELLKLVSSAGNSAGVLDTELVQNFKFLKPLLPEQRAIAATLSDVDALLAALDKLIAKKRDLKQAAMQQLLTGQRRLPGFGGEWEVKRLGDLGHFLKGSGVKKDESLSGDLPCIRYGEIYTKHSDYIKAFYSWVSPEVAATARLMKQGDLLFAGSGETKEEIGKCVAFVDDTEAYAGGDIVILRPEKSSPTFLGFYLNTTPINRQKASRGQGDAVVHISAAALSSIEIIIPKFDEQAAIAAALSDMDAEIAALEARRDKTRALKQGMMQELLTGRIRLV